MISSPVRLFAIVGFLIGLGLIISKFDPSHSELIENGQVLSATSSATPSATESDEHTAPQPQVKSHQAENIFYQGVDIIQSHLNPF